MLTHSPRGRRLSSVLLVLPVLLLLLLTGCSMGAGTPDTSNSTNISTQQPSSSPTSGSSGPGAGSTPAATSTSATTSTAFSVTGISVSVDHPTFTGICGSTVTRHFTGVIHAPAGTQGGSVTYHWVANGGGIFPTHTVTFAAGQTTQAVSETAVTGAEWGNGSQLWLALEVTAPNTLTSVHDTFSFICQRKITGISASANPTFACNSVNHTFTFKATITVSPGPGSVTVTYHWYRSDGGSGSTQTVTIASGQTSVVVQNTWSLFAPITNGSYWEEVIASSPGGFTSNHAAFGVGAC